MFNAERTGTLQPEQAASGHDDRQATVAACTPLATAAGRTSKFEPAQPCIGGHRPFERAVLPE